MNISVWRDRVRRLASDPMVMRSSPATDVYVVHWWLSSLNKLDILSWLFAYFIYPTNKVHCTNIFNIILESVHLLNKLNVYILFTS